MKNNWLLSLSPKFRSGIFIAFFALFAGMSIAWLEFRQTGRLPEVFVQDQMYSSVVDLYLHSNEPQPIPVNQKFEVGLSIIPKFASVVAIDTEILYDNQQLSFVGMVIGNPNLISVPEMVSLQASEVQAQDGSIPLFLALANMDSPGISEKTLVSRLWFARKTQKNTAIKINLMSSVVAVEESDQNAIARGINFEINDPMVKGTPYPEPPLPMWPVSPAQCGNNLCEAGEADQTLGGQCECSISPNGDALCPACAVGFMKGSCNQDCQTGNTCQLGVSCGAQASCTYPKEYIDRPDSVYQYGTCQALAGLGQSCGGTQQIQCQNGLACKIPNVTCKALTPECMYPKGICEKPQRKYAQEGEQCGGKAGITCDPNQVLVCEYRDKEGSPPLGCYYEQVQCVKAPCEPVLVCRGTAIYGGESITNTNAVDIGASVGKAGVGYLYSPDIWQYPYPDATGICRKPIYPPSCALDATEKPICPVYKMIAPACKADELLMQGLRDQCGCIQPSYCEKNLYDDLLVETKSSVYSYVTQDGTIMNRSMTSAQCHGDVVQDRKVDVQDLLGVLRAWGACSGACDADTDNSGAVDVQDLLAVLRNWGPCLL